MPPTADSGMSFRSALDAGFAKTETRTRGENGAPSLTAAGVGDPRVALFFRAVRGASDEQLDELCRAVMSSAEAAFLGADSPQERAAVVADLLVLLFQTRDIHEGKGERALFTSLLLRVHCLLPSTIEALLPLVPDYGCFKDLLALVDAVDAVRRSVSDPERYASLRAAALSVFTEALKRDAGECEGGLDRNPKLSLAAKWAPREGRSHSHLAKEMAQTLFPGQEDARRRYRLMVAGLNKKLNTVEIKMAGDEWDTIDPAAVPARCLYRQRKAFQNKRKGNEQRSDNPKRIACAAAFAAHLQKAREDPKDAKVHGAKLHPHELVNTYLRGGEEDDVVEAQWVDLRERLKDAMAEAEGCLGPIVPLVDVSGSMSGTPMAAAIAMGLLLAELNHPAFRDRMLTFHTIPTWHRLPPAATSSLKTRVDCARRAPWGGTTNFQVAMELLLQSCVDADLSPEIVGGTTLVVFSDMQFDQAGNFRYTKAANPWETQYEMLCNAFAKAGLSTSHKAEYPVPRVVFWNLRGDTRNYPADASTPGVSLLGGFSASMLKLLMEGKLEEMAEKAAQAALPPEERKDAYQVMRKALDHEHFRPVREVCAAVGEGPLAGYQVPPPAATDNAEEDWEVVEKALAAL